MTTPIDIRLPHGLPFAKQWDEWISYRKEIKKPLKSAKSISGCLNQFWLVSEDTAVKMIQQSINNQWQGIFPLKTNGNQKQETDLYYKEPKPPTFSDYKAEPFDRAVGIQHMREKLKKNFENGSPLKDYGDVYTTLLRDFINIPGKVALEIHESAVTEATRPRNRFEEKYTGSVESEVRDNRLNWQLNNWREAGRDISLEI
ncbi:hypothetical protein LCGC14_0388250 [marine sediment metagenome]|uniref:Uncharacterized protein n=1 Tax=marine sediment metagenome TaxID=412755 RepID=A0A0F9W968_9ZZZZ